MQPAPSQPGRAGLLEALEALQHTFENQVRVVRQIMMLLNTVDVEALPSNRVGVGSEVVLLEIETGEQSTWTVIPEGEIDLALHHVSSASPLGHALLERQEGEEVTVATMQGVLRYRVLSLATLPQLLAGLSEILTAERPAAPSS